MKQQVELQRSSSLYARGARFGTVVDMILLNGVEYYIVAFNELPGELYTLPAYDLYFI